MTDPSLASAQIKVDISKSVSTAALAVLAGAVTLLTYIANAHQIGRAFYTLWLLGVALLVAALFVGGRTTNEVATAVSKGTWTGTARSGGFGIQALLTLGGLLFVAVSAVVGVSSDRVPDPTQQRLQKLEVDIAQFRQREVTSNEQVAELERHLKRMQNALERLRARSAG